MSALLVIQPHLLPVDQGLHQMSTRAADVHKLIAATAIGANEMPSITVDFASNRSKRQLRLAPAAPPHFKLPPGKEILV
jgi:hypothetical protein